ncbi:MAG TPA: hypothetical protein VHN20_10085, partial [Beijerinckiaceae bacterium]|nr:hypothetical protein [Beijerinckiaceae bacterium]
HPIARGQVVVTGTRIAIEITEIIRKPEVLRGPGTCIGASAIAAQAAAEPAETAETAEPEPA